MLDENIENLSPDDGIKDIDNIIEKKEERESHKEDKSDGEKNSTDDIDKKNPQVKADDSEKSITLDEIGSKKPEPVIENSEEKEKAEVVEEEIIDGINDSETTVEEDGINDEKKEKSISEEVQNKNESDDSELDETDKDIKEVVSSSLENSEKKEKAEVVEEEIIDGQNDSETIEEDGINDEKIEKPISEEVQNKNESDDSELDETDKDIKEVSSSKESITKDKEEKEVPVVDYTKMDMDELVALMQQLVNDFSINKIKVQFEALRSDFNKKYKSFIAAKQKEFIGDGGNEIDFKFYLPIKKTFNDVLHDFKKKRQKYYKDLEEEQKLNLERKLQLINNLKELIDTAEPSTMYKNFRTLQDEWRTIGQIPHTKYNDVWRTYHHHVERFYDLLHLNNDFRDLDFKHNLEEKTKLIEKVEKLGDDPDVNRAFKELQIIHRMWKEDIGPVGRDVREEVWNRFSEATKIIHNKRHEFQNELESKFKENVGLKLAIVDKIKAIKTEEHSSHKLWQNSIKQMEDLRKEFFAIGRVPRSKNEEVWQIFKDATRNFNKAKNIFYKSIKKEQSDNLERKMKLIVQAESLKESEDWEVVTGVFKKIQADWKNIGHVPRRDSDRIWKRFKEACNYFFDQLHNMQDGHNKDQTLIFNKKKELLERFKSDIELEDKLNLDLVNEYISEWRKLGVVPVNMRHIEAKLNKVIDAACKKLDISKEESTLLKFKNVINAFLEQKDVRKLDNEQLFIKRKVDDLTKEIKQLENNISFISNATDDNPLVRNVYNNIEKYNKDLKIWVRKLTYIRQLEY